eukprot:Skav231540  [mRNA]  locus=scaffold84:731438:731989:+ [translate_table: standard]
MRIPRGTPDEDNSQTLRQKRLKTIEFVGQSQGRAEPLLLLSWRIGFYGSLPKRALMSIGYGLVQLCLSWNQDNPCHAARTVFTVQRVYDAMLHCNTVLFTNFCSSLAERARQSRNFSIDDAAGSADENMGYSQYLRLRKWPTQGQQHPRLKTYRETKKKLAIQVVENWPQPECRQGFRRWSYG